MGKRFLWLISVLLAVTTLVMIGSLWVPSIWQDGLWRLWPLGLLDLGLFFLLTPLLFPGHRGLGSFFIPAVPALTAAGLMLVASLTDDWTLWTQFWPLMVMASAVGLALAAYFMRVIWLLIPAVMVGMIGPALQFCTLTGRWEIWVVLWILAPLSTGLGLLGVAFRRGYQGLWIAGLVLCATALAGLIWVGFT